MLGIRPLQPTCSRTRQVRNVSQRGEIKSPKSSALPRTTSLPATSPTQPGRRAFALQPTLTCQASSSSQVSTSGSASFLQVSPPSVVVPLRRTSPLCWIWDAGRRTYGDTRIPSTRAPCLVLVPSETRADKLRTCWCSSPASFYPPSPLPPAYTNQQPSYTRLEPFIHPRPARTAPSSRPSRPPRARHLQPPSLSRRFTANSPFRRACHRRGKDSSRPNRTSLERGSVKARPLASGTR